MKGDRSKGVTQIHMYKKEMTKKKKKKRGRRKLNKIKRHIPMNSASCSAISSSSESKILFFMVGSSLGSLRMSLDPSEEKSILGPRVAELRMEEGVTTKEEPSFTA